MGNATSACCSIDKVEHERGSVFVEGPSSPGVGGKVQQGSYDPSTQTGYVERRFPDGGEFKGYLKNGMRHGLGRYVYPDATSIFEGEWRDDKCNGQGKLKDDESELSVDEFSPAADKNCRQPMLTTTSYNMQRSAALRRSCRKRPRPRTSSRSPLVSLSLL
ncbi:unnamed protein product, partial [Amoebophrya sp. A25]|eukprot:GSA25T00019850001.1